MRWTKRRTATLENAIDDLFVFCGLSEESARKSPLWLTKCKVGPKDFHEAEAFIDDPDGNLIGVSKDENAVSFFSDVTPSDVSGFDVSSAKSFVDETGKRSVELYRLRQESIRKARGFRIYSPHVASLYSCWIDIDKGEYTSKKILVNKAGEEWVPLGSESEYSHFAKSQTLSGHFWTFGIDDGQGISSTCNVLLSLAFTRDLTWRVVFRGPSGLSFSLSTDTAGAMAAFKNRQPNDTTGRRDALKHWVRQHYRNRPASEGDEAQRVIVRQHLRGRTPFRWFGIDCELVVSPFDMRRNERFRIERESIQAAT